MSAAETFCLVFSIVSSFIDVADLYRVRRVCASCRTHYGSRSCLKAALLYGGGVPNELRHKFWSFCLKVDDAQEQIYPKSFEDVRHFGGEASLSLTGVEGEIKRDVGRTLPSNTLFMDKSGVGQILLSNILKACTEMFPDVAYCQGMNFVVACFLLTRLQRPGNSIWVAGPEDSVLSMTSDDSESSMYYNSQSSRWFNTPSENECCAEEDVFWLMAALLLKRPNGERPNSSFSMRGLWLPGCPELKLRVFQFQTLLEKELPRLISHFKRIGMQLEILTSQWFLTLFAYSLPVEVLIQVWDCVFIDGWKAVFRIGLARLKAVEHIMLKLELEEMSCFLKSFRLNIPFQGVSFTSEVHSLLRESYKVKVTRSYLEDVQTEFAIVLIREHLRLNIGEEQWLLRYGTPEDSLREHPSGIEAVIRMMILDDHLFGKLRSEVETVSGEMECDIRWYKARIKECEEIHSSALETITVLDKHIIEEQIELEELHERIDIFIHQMHFMVDRDLPNDECRSTEKNLKLTTKDPTLIEKPQTQLSSDLKGFNNKVCKVHIDLQAIQKLLKTNYTKLSYAKAEAEEALERKVAFCSQLDQLLKEQKSKIDARIKTYARRISVLIV